MLTKFALISELLTIDQQGKYVVRVMVLDQGQAIASGLAASETVEMAEDKARQRALSLINDDLKFSQSTSEIVTPQKPLTPIQKNQFDFNSSYDKNYDKNKTIFFHDNTKKINNTTDIQSPQTTINSQNQSPISTSLESEELPLRKENPESYSSKEFLDCSSIIGKTEIELKRLGWTQEQGKNYLLETYGKKSRHLLSDEELIEFCHYLESQS